MLDPATPSREAVKPIGAAPLRPRHVAAVCLPVDAVHPATFLRMAEGRARGFWARGGSWVAHAGATATIRLEGACAPDGRYATAWRCAARIVTHPSGEDGAGAARRPRFYGGLAFLEDHVPSDAWAAFPSGLFMLPEIELEGGASGYRLRLHREVASPEEAASAEACLEEEARALALRLAREPRPEPTSVAHAPELAAMPRPGDREAWDRVVTDALEAIDADRFSKVVLARTLDVAPGVALDPVDVLMALRSENPRAHVFLFEHEPAAVLVGAAPETVATVYGQDFHATAVAGSVPHGDTPEATSALAAALLDSAKDQREHEFAVRDMVARLRDIALEVSAEWEPHVITLSRIQHLETRIRARLPLDCTVLDALEALHPTPAVCGLPRDAALRFIRDEEPFERGWYAGPVGWFDLEGSGVFAPALRSAVARDGVWRLFAGAGIVSGSQPDSEWAETGIKFEPVLRALAASLPR